MEEPMTDDPEITNDDLLDEAEGEIADEPGEDPLDEIADESDEAESDEVDLTKLDEPDDTAAEVDEDIETTLESVTEAVLFASDEPLTAQRLVGIAEAGSIKQIKACIEDLNEKYKAANSAFRIEKIAGGYQMMTLSPYNYWLKKLLRTRTDTKLSPAALEALAIISYKQPIIRADIEAIRGVASGEVIRNLMYKGLVKIVGRAEVLGRPMLYGTTKKFLDTFGLNTLKDLPKIEELKKPLQ